MTGKFRLILITFLIITSFTTALSYVARHEGLDNPLHLIGAFFLMGVFLSLIMSLIILKTVKAVQNEVIEGAEPEVPEEAEEEINLHVVQTLSLLQKGRFIDFLKENIEGFDDSQIGAAVKNIHKQCNEALEEYVIIEPVMQEVEGDEVLIKEDFDPSKIRLTGNVVGKPPFKGILKHSGWRVQHTKLPHKAKSQDKSIIEPAEVEVI
jgi:hypothetical protein